jgi:hypothetical protein
MSNEQWVCADIVLSPQQRLQQLFHFPVLNVYNQGIRCHICRTSPETCGSSKRKRRETNGVPGRSKTPRRAYFPSENFEAIGSSRCREDIARGESDLANSAAESESNGTSYHRLSLAHVSHTKACYGNQ